MNCCSVWGQDIPVNSSCTCFKFSVSCACKLGAGRCQQRLFEMLRDPWAPRGCWHCHGPTAPPWGTHTGGAGICCPWKSSWRQEGKSQPVFNENLYSVRQIPGKSEKVLRCPLRVLFYRFAFHSNGTDFIWSSQLFYGGGLRWKQGVNSGCTRASGALDTGTVRNIDPPGNEEYISNLWGIFYSILRRPVS